jgi:hypothetical protein
LLSPVRSAGSRTWFVLGRAERAEATEHRWNLQPLPGRSSADLFGTCHANCYFEVPPGGAVFSVGDPLPFECLTEETGSLSNLFGTVFA